MTAWMATVTGNVMSHFNPWQRVPFSLLFKAVFGCAVAGIIMVGALLAFVHVGESIETALKVLAALMGAVFGAYSARRAVKDAFTPH
jgi:hypothetical protein